MGWTCPVCGKSALKSLARNANGQPSLEICPSCGFQFGVSDDVQGYSYEQWRRKVIGAFDYNDTVTARPGADARLRPGEVASIVAVIRQTDREGKFLESFPIGTVYIIEFNDGSSVEICEGDLIKLDTNEIS